LDASGTSGLVIDNLSVTWWLAAASTPPLCGFRSSRRENCMPKFKVANFREQGVDLVVVFLDSWFDLKSPNE
jgi:hypothetical protein